jgi:hypothetical protein
MCYSIVVRIDPQLLENPDADIRYVLPDLLAERSSGIITDDGYDYMGETPLLMLYLQVSDLQLALACILDIVQHVRVLGNNLEQAVVVAIKNDNDYEVVYPLNFTGSFMVV